VDPLAGVFIREFAKATHGFHDVRVVYAYLSTVTGVSQQIEDGILTIRARYGRSLLKVLQKLAQRNPTTGSTTRVGIRQAISRTVHRTIGLVTDPFTFCVLFRQFRRMLHEGWTPDVIHAHGFLAGVHAVLIGFLSRIPVVVHEHWSGFIWNELTLLDKMKSAFVFSSASSIIPVSDVLWKNMQKYGIRGRAHVVPNTVDTKMFSPSSTGRKGEKIRLLFVGRLVEEKGLIHLLQAMSIVRKRRNDFVLDVVGDGPLRDELQALSSELQLKDSIRFHGFKPKSEVAEFMKASDFYVQASVRENLGCTYIEAMACGKPVVATTAGATSSLISESRGLLVPPGNSQALAEAILRMLDHYSEFSSEEIAAFVQDRFSYEAVGKALSGIYEKVMEAYQR